MQKLSACDAQCSLDIAAYIKTWALNAAVESASSPAVSNTTHNISFLNDCGKGVTAPTNGLTIIGDYNTASSNQAIAPTTNGDWTWNAWTNTNGTPSAWVNTQFASNLSTYSVPSSGKANSSCNNVDTADMLLVKKYADWDQQHANGFDTLSMKNMTFGKVAFIVMDIKVNSARTSLLTQDALVAKYSSYTSEANLRAYDKGYVNLGFTLIGQDTSLTAFDIIEINQNMFKDQWIRVKIDMSKVKYCSTANYYCTTKTQTELANTSFTKFTVVAETGAGGTLRNITNPTWSTSTPEAFKELDISIKKLEFIYK
jgi:hypothetical protein